MPKPKKGKRRRKKARPLKTETIQKRDLAERKVHVINALKYYRFVIRDHKNRIRKVDAEIQKSQDKKESYLDEYERAPATVVSLIHKLEDMKQERTLLVAAPKVTKLMKLKARLAELDAQDDVQQQKQKGGSDA